MNTSMHNHQVTNPNAPTFASVMEAAKELGEQAGKGKDSQIKFSLKVLEGAYVGALDLQPNKHGDGLSDTRVLSEAYYKAQTGSNVFDHKAGNQRKLQSCTQLCIKVGMIPKWGVGQPLGICNDMLTIRDKAKKAGEPVVDAQNTLMKFLRHIAKRDDLPSEDEIKALVLKKDPDKRDAEDIWEAIKKMAEKLKAGTVTNCPDVDDSKETDQIIKTAERRLKAIAKLRATNEVHHEEDEVEEGSDDPRALHKCPSSPPLEPITGPLSVHDSEHEPTPTGLAQVTRQKMEAAA